MIRRRVRLQRQPQREDLLQPVAEFRHQPAQVLLRFRQPPGENRRLQRLHVAAARPAPDHLQRITLQRLHGQQRDRQGAQHPHGLQILLQPAKVVAQLGLEEPAQSGARRRDRFLRRGEKPHRDTRGHRLQSRIGLHRDAVVLAHQDPLRQIAEFPLGGRLALPFHAGGPPCGVVHRRRLLAHVARAAVQLRLHLREVAAGAQHPVLVVHHFDPHPQVIGEGFPAPQCGIDPHPEPR